jgi:CheY-like chemotaxis protein
MMPSENNIRRRNILVADANADFRALLCHYLDRLNYPAPIQAQDGAEALSMALALEPCLILMEIRLPKMTGLEVVARLRKNPSAREIWMVAATAMALPGDREKCLRSGFDAYLAKPFTLKEFEELLLTVSTTRRNAAGY